MDGYLFYCERQKAVDRKSGKVGYERTRKGQCYLSIKKEVLGKVFISPETSQFTEKELKYCMS